MKNIAYQALAAAAAISVGSFANAGEIDWNYLEAEYIGGQFEDGTDISGVGIKL
jgi:hypothetical protein